MSTPSSEHTVSRRGFLKLAGGAALGAAMFSMPSFSFARELDNPKRTLKPVAFKNIPKNAVAAAQASPLVQKSFDDIVRLANTIENGTLRQAVVRLLNDPTPTFMQEYSSAASRSRLYSALAAQNLIDTSKIDETHILPPFNGAIQQFKTAPGSGYGSHHPYPGGLATHTSCNMHITDYICRTYEEVFYYAVNKDIAIAAQALHDISKPFVFQWKADGSSLTEYPIAGQGAHHALALAEVIYRGFPAEEVVAQACAHGAPTSKKEEADVAGWLKAAAIIAGKDPVAYGLVGKDGQTIPHPHRQEGYIVHLGDHDWVLSSPAAQKTVLLLKKIAYQEYGMSRADLEGAAFNHFRNYVEAQLSCMYLNMLEAEPNGYKLAAEQVAKVILK